MAFQQAWRLNPPKNRLKTAYKPELLRIENWNNPQLSQILWDLPSRGAAAKNHLPMTGAL